MLRKWGSRCVGQEWGFQVVSLRAWFPCNLLRCCSSTLQSICSVFPLWICVLLYLFNIIFVAIQKKKKKGAPSWMQPHVKIRQGNSNQVGQIYFYCRPYFVCTIYAVARHTLNSILYTSWPVMYIECGHSVIFEHPFLQWDKWTILFFWAKEHQWSCPSDGQLGSRIKISTYSSISSHIKMRWDPKTNV